MQLDYTLKTSVERNDYVLRLIENRPALEPLKKAEVEKLATYITEPITKLEKKKREILTSNRSRTIDKRETSLEGFMSKFEWNEDMAYGFFTEDKRIIFMPKVTITSKDLEEIPGMQELRDAIESVNQQQLSQKGRRRYLLIKQMIELQKDQYILRNAYRKPIYFLNAMRGDSKTVFDEKVIVNEDYSLTVESNCSLLVEDHVKALLQHYSDMKQSGQADLNSDAYVMILDLENLIESTFGSGKEPILYDVLISKIDGLSNRRIWIQLKNKYGDKSYSETYISTLWHHRIPKMLADSAQEKYLEWYFTQVEKGKWKRCGKCKQRKLLCDRYFGRLGKSVDGFSSICKECRREEYRTLKQESEEAEKE